MRKIYELRAELECELLRNGKTVFSHAQQCQSFTKWFKRFTGNIFTATGGKYFGKLKLKDVGGTDFLPSQAVGVWTYNIIDSIGIGTSDEPFDYNQFQLSSFLMYATGLTRSIDLQDYDTSVRFELTGTFNITENATIRETGLYGLCPDEGVIYRRWLVSRDILTNPVDVAPGDILIVRYRVTIS
jgi:hypothetical protein